MSKRFDPLFRIPKNQYIEGAPILLVSGGLLKDGVSGAVFAQIKFQSVSEKQIQAVKLSLDAFDISGSEVQGVSDYQYLDMNVRDGQEFGANKAIIMPSSVARSIQITSIVVVFADGSTWESKETFMPLSAAEPLAHAVSEAELRNQYQLEINKQAEYTPQEERGLWMCSCGTWNSGSHCTKCRVHRHKVFSSLDNELLTKQRDIRLAKEIEQREAEEARQAQLREEERIKRAALLKQLKIVGIAVVAVILAVIAVALLVKMVIVKSKYDNAIALMEAGSYEEAIAAFEALDGYKDSEEQIENCEIGILDDKYDAAVALMEAGGYEEAIIAFEALAGHKDSAEQIDTCAAIMLADRYDVALGLMNAGSYIEAISAFEALAEYEDSEEQLQECRYNYAVALTETGNYEEAVTVFEALDGYKDSEEQLQECRYNYAVALMEENETYNARVIFEELGDYKDSEERLAMLRFDGRWAWIFPSVYIDGAFTSMGDIFTFDIESQTITHRNTSAGTITEHTYSFEIVDSDTLYAEGLRSLGGVTITFMEGNLKLDYDNPNDNPFIGRNVYFIGQLEDRLYLTR